MSGVAETGQKPPYTGLKAIELAEDVGGEFLGRMLAEMGAEVTKVEPPQGSPTRAIGPFVQGQEGPDASLNFWYYNTDKRSLVVAPEATAARLADLLADADVLIVSLQPARQAALGLDLNAIAAANPKLIVVSMTPYGLTGPWKDYAPSNLTAIAGGGPLMMCGYDDHAIPPVNPGGDQAYHTSAAFGHIAVLAALLDRQQTGLGQVIDLSMHSANALNTELGNPYWFYNGVNVQRQTCRHAQPVMTQPAMFQCADGSYVYYTLILADQHSWKILVGWMDEMGMAAMLTEPEFSDVVHRQQHMGEIQELVECFFLIQDGHEAYLEGQKRGLPIGIVNAPEELLEDEHLRERAFFVPVDTGTVAGTVLFPGDSYRFSAFSAVPKQRAPRLGEHGGT
ncbi:CoA transferase [Novosphingobium sp. KCTC 2891]|uniref:CaiB/BaiF CoA transferase family protein n=1 Tax=Novosphingobium sp. KCTC 2891 TaxID=2989730 RepID=UPI002222B2ED|nr:CoA transferase [Novosphingobium sp. KCTC 2891]MCW1384696.1 CoA transferase [Novosphingobium sp. KCTC 2891]